MSAYTRDPTRRSHLPVLSYPIRMLFATAHIESTHSSWCTRTPAPPPCVTARFISIPCLVTKSATACKTVPYVCVGPALLESA